MSKVPITLIRLCCLRAAPQELPTSTPVTIVTLVLYGVVNVLLAAQSVPWAHALEASLIDALLLAAFTQFVLNARGLGERVRQTLLALAGTGIPIVAVMLGAGYFYKGVPTPVYVWLPILIWQLAVYGHVLRHALNVPFRLGLLAAGGYVFVSLILAAIFL